MKLKMCPFCGYKPEYFELVEITDDSVIHKEFNYCCNNPECMVQPSTWGNSKYYAKKYWNDRVEQGE